MQKSESLFLEQYQRELLYLKESGKQFAQDHPKVAKRLDWDGNETRDPHVERLIESFAFLTAKLQRNISDRFPILSNALLSTLYPQFINPIPSLSMAQFSIEKSKASPGYHVPKGTGFTVSSKESIQCKFQTCFDIKLWPIKIESAEIFPTNALPSIIPGELSPYTLKLTLKSTGVSFEDMSKLDSLPIYLQGDIGLVSRLYDALFLGIGRIFAEDSKGKIHHILPPNALKSMGFSRDEIALPQKAEIHPSYIFMQEYFAFPEKFLYMNLTSLNLKGFGDEFSLYIPLNETIAEYENSISTENFGINCVPIINLFQKTTEPIKIDQHSTQYLLTGDFKKEKTTEIHSIESLSALLSGENERRELPAYFSFDFETSLKKNTIYWFATRQKIRHKNLPGTEMVLNFVDFNFRPELPATDVIWGQALCTNRFAAEQIQAGTKLYPDNPIPSSRIHVLYAPTPQFIPAETGQAQWNLIAQLSSNQLSLLNVQRLKHILKLYIPKFKNNALKEIDSILEINHVPSVRRVGPSAWRGFVHGIDITITLDEQMFSSSSIVLFGEVLYHVFGLSVNMNSFITLKLQNNQNKVIKTWGPLCGYKPLL